MRSWRFSVWLVVVSLLAAACGGGDDSQVESAPNDAPATTVAAVTEAPTTQAPTTSMASTTTTAAESPSGFVGADGVESLVASNARIVSLNGDLTEIIWELGLGENLAAVDVTTIYPPETEDLPRVGFGQRLSAESVLAFGPTVVVGDEQIGPPESIEQIRAAGVPVVIFETQTTLPGVATKIRQVADVLGVPGEGAELADRVSAEIAEAQALASGAGEQPSVAFIYVRGPETLLLFGQGMVTQALIEGANAVDTGAASGVRGAVPLTPEALVAASPEIIIWPEIGVGALGGPEALASIPGVAETPAGQNGSFLIYDDALFLNFGPRTGEALHQLVRDLHPDLAG